MSTTILRATFAAAAILIGSVAAAQKLDPMAGVPAADQATVSQCRAMPHGAMMKKARCRTMIKAHPDAFAGTVSSN